MPTNLVREVSFSDAQSVSNQPAGLLTLVYTATGGETSFQKDELINAAVTNLSRDGSVYSPVSEFSVTPKKEFIHYPADGDQDAGTIVFHPGLPPMETGEDSVINYVPGAAVPFDVTEPVTLDEVKAWCKIEVDDDDVILTALISAARQMCEGYANMSFVQRTVTAYLQNDLGGIRLPYGPVGDIQHMYDNAGTEIISDNYTVSGNTVKRIISPTTNCGNVIKVVYAAGHSALPKIFKTAILMQTAWLYQHRGDAVDSVALSPDAIILLKPYRTVV